jgi:hypothetical protein
MSCFVSLFDVYTWNPHHLWKTKSHSPSARKSLAIYEGWRICIHLSLTEITVGIFWDVVPHSLVKELIKYQSILLSVPSWKRACLTWRWRQHIPPDIADTPQDYMTSRPGRQHHSSLSLRFLTLLRQYWASHNLTLISRRAVESRYTKIRSLLVW